MAARARRVGGARRVGEGGRPAARAREAPRARADRPAARLRLVRRARPLRPSSRDRVRHAREQAVGRCGRHRLRHGVRATGVRLQPGLHRLRRLPVGGLRREGLQGDGHGPQGRVPRRRDQRLGRRADPGGRRLARRLRRDLLAQRAGVGGRPADLADHGAVRGRRRLLARDHGLRADDRGHVLHVHHGARRREDRHGRGGELRGARRRERARNEVGCRAPRRAGRAGVRRRRALPAHVSSPEQPRDGALRASDRPGRSRVTRARRA